MTCARPLSSVGSAELVAVDCAALGVVYGSRTNASEEGQGELLSVAVGSASVFGPVGRSERRDCGEPSPLHQGFRSIAGARRRIRPRRVKLLRGVRDWVGSEGLF